MEANSADMRILGRNFHILWEARSAPIDPIRPVSVPMGTPVSQAFTVIGGAEAEPMRHALAVMDSLHGDGNLPMLIAKREVLKNLDGNHQPGPHFAPAVGNAPARSEVF